MPIYEYQCEKCGLSFEAMQAMSDDALTECIECGGPVHRVLFAPAIHFKGSGFHNTDYGTKKRPKDDKSGGGDAGANGSSGSSEGASGGASAGDGGAATTTKEATPKDRAARGTGP